MTQNELNSTLFFNADNRQKTETPNYTAHTITIKNVVAITELVLHSHATYCSPISSQTHYILPIIGSSTILLTNKQQEDLHADEILKCSTNTTNFTIQNHHSESIKMLLIDIRMLQENGTNAIVKSAIHFGTKNKWTEIEGIENLSINVLDSRTKGDIHYPKATNAILYAVNGSFEIENRIVNKDECLFLYNITTIEYEALAEFAILLQIVLPI